MKPFDTWLKEFWPKEIPEDCTNLDKSEDCITRSDDDVDKSYNEPKEWWCSSCLIYEALSTYHDFLLEKEMEDKNE